MYYLFFIDVNSLITVDFYRRTPICPTCGADALGPEGLRERLRTPNKLNFCPRKEHTPEGLGNLPEKWKAILKLLKRLFVL